MPSKNTAADRSWIRDEEGVFAYVDNTDKWIPLGWKPAADPDGSSLVWLEHNVTHGKAKFAKSVLQQWAALGWEPSDPPEPVDVTKDENLVDSIPVEPEPAAPKKAASGSKEK